MEGDVLVEGNYFFNTPIPTETSRDGSPPGDLVERFNVYESCGLPGTRGTAFEASNYYLYFLQPASEIPATVSAYAGSGKYDFSNPVHIVPVELTSFNASVSGSSVFLNWSTASETNNYGFEIEKEESGKWSRIGFVPGKGTSTVKNIYSFRDNNPSKGSSVYRLKQIDYNGTFIYKGSVEARYSEDLSFGLSQNFPNPFGRAFRSDNAATQIKYTIPSAGYVTLDIYDVLGNLVKTLVSENKSAGEYTVGFVGNTLASGVYIYKLKAGGNFASRKMIIVK